MFSLLFLYEWNLCMFAMSFVYINGIFGFFLRRLLIRIEYVNHFFIVCLYEWHLWMFLYSVYISESVCFIVNLYE
jgi:hypothetical protein